MSTSLQEARYSAQNPNVAEGWRLERLTPPSRLFGANGLRTGPDGRIYIAQVTGSQISALDVGTGLLETISAKGGDIIAPDDVAFDPDGNLYATEVMDGRVSVRDDRRHKPGAARRPALRQRHHRASGAGCSSANAARADGCWNSTWQWRCRHESCWTIVPSPNAMEVGPDGLLYFPVMGANEIWRIDPDGGEPQRVAGDLGVPDSVKFDSDGYIVSTQVASGQVLRIDPRSGEQTLLANLTPGLDNLHLRRRPAVRLELHRRDHRDPRRRPHPNGAARRAELAAGPRRSATTAGCTSPTAPTSMRLRRTAHCRQWGCCSRRAIPGSCAASHRPGRVSSW